MLGNFRDRTSVYVETCTIPINTGNLDMMFQKIDGLIKTITQAESLQKTTSFPRLSMVEQNQISQHVTKWDGVVQG